MNKKIQVFCFKLVNQNRKVNALCFGLRQSNICEVNYVNEMNIKQVIDKIKLASCLLIDSSVYFACEESALESRYISFVGKKDIKKYQEILHTLMTSSVKKIYIALAHDIHWPGIDIKFLCENIQGIIWAHHAQPLLEEEFMASSYRESWGDAHGDYMKTWQYIKERIPVSIEMPFFAFENEFFNKKKFFDICVTGSNYKTRTKAREMVDKYPTFKKAPYETVDNIINLISSKTPKNRLNNFVIIQLRALNQRFCTSRSFSSFVCGSFLRYPVAKFFEIPAQGSLSLAMPCVQYESYGFKEGVHYIHTEPENIIEVLKYVKLNKKLCKKIVRNSQELVMREHSFKNRIRQLEDVLRAFQKDKAIQAGYCDGKYEIHLS